MKKTSVAASALLLSLSLGTTASFAQAPAATPASAPAAVDQDAAPAAKPNPNDVFARVNGKPVQYSRVLRLLEARRQSPQGQQQPLTAEQEVLFERQARDFTVRREILTQEAVRRGLGTSPRYLEQMEDARQNILWQELVKDEESRISDADLQAAYDKFKAQFEQQRPEKEFRARHILVAKEALAKSLISQLQAGAKFEDLAKRHSTDEVSARQGGDLDWANPSTYVPPFAAAVKELQKGQVTKSPVKTSFGFHVIRVDDIREPAFPSMEEVKPELRRYLAQERRATMENDLIKNARTDHKFAE